MPKSKPNKDAEAFGARLVNLLAAAGQPRRGAGAYLQRRYRVSNVVANAWLNGEYKPEIPTARQIALDHGGTFDALYFGDEPGPVMSQSERQDLERIADATAVIFGWLQERGVKFDPDRDRELIKSAHDYFASNDAADVTSLRAWLESHQAKKGARNVGQGKAGNTGQDGVGKAARPARKSKTGAGGQ